MQGTLWRTTHPTIWHARYQLSHVQVLWLWHHRLRIWPLLSVIRGLAITALPRMLDFWSSRQTVFMGKRTSRWIFSYAAICAAVVLWYFKTILLNVQQPLSVNVDFHPLFLFADAVFPWFVYADKTLETVTRDTPNKVALFVTDTPTICSLPKSDKSTIFRFFHMNCHSTQPLMHLHKHYRL
jgi:hypothetical protein